MSWPLKYDPASQSISFGGRDKTLYPNSLAPFDQAALAAGDVSRTYCDHNRSRRPRPENEVFGVGDEKVEDKEADDAGSREDRCICDTPLYNTTCISYTTINQLEESRQKRFMESLARGKWNRYRRQYTLNTSYEAHKSANSLSTTDRASAFRHCPTDVPYLALFETHRAALADQGPGELGLKDRSIEGEIWNSVPLPASPAVIIRMMGKDLAILDVDLGMSEARLGTITERCFSPHMSVGEKQALVGAAPKERVVFKNQIKGMSRELNVSHKQSFLQRLLHPKDNIIKPAIQLATEVFCSKHNKIQQPETRPLGVDVAKKVLSKRDVKEWRAMRGYRPLFSQKWVQSVAKAIEKGKEKEKSGMQWRCDKYVEVWSKRLRAERGTRVGFT